MEKKHDLGSKLTSDYCHAELYEVRLGKLGFAETEDLSLEAWAPLRDGPDF